MKKASYTPMFTSDFLGSSFVRGLNSLQKQCYMWLLLSQADADDRRLPDDIESLWRLSDADCTLEKFRTSVWPRISKKFEPCEDGNGGLVNPRMWDVTNDRDAHIRKKSEAGKVAVEARERHRKDIDRSSNDASTDISNDDQDDHQENPSVDHQPKTKTKEEKKRGGTREQVAPPPEPILTFGESGHVRLTATEHEKLTKELGPSRLKQYIDRLDGYIGQIGIAKAAKRYVSHLHVIRNWYRRDLADGKIQVVRETSTGFRPVV